MSLPIPDDNLLPWDDSQVLLSSQYKDPTVTFQSPWFRFCEPLVPINTDPYQDTLIGNPISIFPPLGPLQNNSRPLSTERILRPKSLKVLPPTMSTEISLTIF